MKRFPPLSVDFILQRLRVDLGAGRVYWRDATKFHRRLEGREAGLPRSNRRGKKYWVVKINGLPYKRATLILAVATGEWPRDQVDHKNGDSLDDGAANLRAATALQNAWNHKGRKRRISLPMGIRRAYGGRFQARISVNKKQITLGTFDTIVEAVSQYQAARLKHFGEFA